MLNDLETSIPYYHGRHVTGEIPEPEPTSAMQLGSAFDSFLLEPDEFTKRVAVAPAGVTRRHKAFETVTAGSPERLVLTAEEYAGLESWRDGVYRNPFARAALEAAGRRQVIIRWTCPDSGLPRKAMIDMVQSNGLLIDLKTAADPSPEAWAKAVVNYRYHRQAAAYLEGSWEALRADGPFCFIVVGKEPPHECIVYELDDEALNLGRTQNRRLLRELAGRAQSGDWSSRWHDRVQLTSLPRWAFYGETLV